MYCTLFAFLPLPASHASRYLGQREDHQVGSHAAALTPAPPHTSRRTAKVQIIGSVDRSRWGKSRRESRQARALDEEEKFFKKKAEWVKKSRDARDLFEISQDYKPLTVQKRLLLGVPNSLRVLELLNISEAIRLKQGSSKW